MTIPSIPDNINRLLLLAGIFLLGFLYYLGDKNNESYFPKVEAVDSSIDSLNIQIMKNENQKIQLIKFANDIATRYNVKNPITDNDSLVIFSKTLVGSKLEIRVSDSLSKLWEDFKEKQFNIALSRKQIQIKKESLENAKEEHKAIKKEINWAVVVGLLLICMGYFGMSQQQKIQDELLKRQLQDKQSIYNYCQSCGKNFSSMRQNGKRIDGTLNNAFCISCYDNGKFTEPDLTEEEFAKRAAAEVRKRATWWGRKKLAIRLKNLERWNTNEYY